MKMHHNYILQKLIDDVWKSTHCGLVMPCGITELGQYFVWVVAWCTKAQDIHLWYKITKLQLEMHLPSASELNIDLC